MEKLCKPHRSLNPAKGLPPPRRFRLRRSTKRRAKPSRLMLDPELLNLLCCPETHQELRPADRALLEELNKKIVAGELRNRIGRPISEKLDEGLVRADGGLLYPVRN